MTIRPFKFEDLEAIRSLGERYSDFPFPDVNDPLYTVKEVAEVDGKIIGAGLLRMTSEAVLILDLKCPQIQRAYAIERLLYTGIQKSQIDEIHTFLTGEMAHNFASFLRRKFGFEDVRGIPLVLRK